MINIDSNELLNKYLDRERLALYLDEVQQANQRFNLVSRNATLADLELLTAESLIPIEQGWIDEKSGPLLDIGSGWGIPAVPMLLAGLDIKITMVERSQKKADFLLLLLHRLGLKAEIVSNDLQAFKSPSKYATITMRGVAVDNKLIRKLKQLSELDTGIIYFGDKFSGDLLNQSQAIEYSIDNLPVRKLIKYHIV